MPIQQPTPQELSQARAASLVARRARADLKREIHDGAKTVRQALMAAYGDEALRQLRVIDVVRSVPGVGQVRATKTMERLGIALNRRVGGLGSRQFEALSEEFDA